MDELGGFEPTDTTGFIQIESIRIKKYVRVHQQWLLAHMIVRYRWAQANIRKNQAGVTAKDAYASKV